jgi:hypothetical protein
MRPCPRLKLLLIYATPKTVSSWPKMLVKKFLDVVILAMDLKIKKHVCLASTRNALRNVRISMELMETSIVQFATFRLFQLRLAFVVVVAISST